MSQKLYKLYNFVTNIKTYISVHIYSSNRAEIECDRNFSVINGRVMSVVETKLRYLEDIVTLSYEGSSVILLRRFLKICALSTGTLPSYPRKPFARHDG